LGPQEKSTTRNLLEQELKQIKAAQLNPARFAPLYDRYYKPIYIFIFKKVRDQELAGDLTSQVFLKAMLNLKKYEYKGFPFSSWLYRIAANEVNMHYRKSNKVMKVAVRESDVITLMGEMDESDTRENEQQLMIQALRELSDEHVELVELRFFQKYSFKEIGEILGLSEGNAKIKLYRVLDRLKKAINLKRKV
jgi:RNA polymerase sigma-70 factor (ECF subfamily)